MSKLEKIILLMVLLLTPLMGGCLSLDLQSLNPTYGYGYQVVKQIHKIDGGYKVEFNDFIISTDALGR